MHTIFIYDDIGPDWMGMVSARYVLSEIDKAKGGAITVRINSPGGDVFEGQAIYNALSRRGNVTVEVDAVAASAASFIAMAGDTIRMAENAMLMIHNAWGLTVGDKAEHQRRYELLDKVDGIIAETYAARSGKPVAEIAAMMSAETWFTAKEAVANGLATEIGQPLKVAASIKEGRFNHTPANLIASTSPRDERRAIRQRQLETQIRLTKAKAVR